MEETIQKSILLVEDEAVLAMAQKQSIEKYGYTVTTTNSGEKAVDIMDKSPEIDLILMDINLGKGIDGTETASRILLKHDIPIIFFSSHTEPQIVKKTENISFYGFVEKKTSMTILDATIKMAFKLFSSKILEKNKLKNYFDQSIVSMVLVGMNKSFIDCNEAFCKFTGYTKDEILQKSIGDITFHEDLDKGNRELKRLVEGSIQSAIIDKRYIHKSGSLVWGELNISMIGNKETLESYFLATVVDITSRKQVEEINNSLIAEKEMLLKEVHHRIKNNMNTIQGLLSLQAEAYDNILIKDALQDAGNRVKSMQILYDKLYRSPNFTELPVAAFFSPLVDEIISSFPDNSFVTVIKKFDDFPLTSNILQPLGIIIYELLTNIMKYAFTDGSGGQITISAALSDDKIILTVSDDGTGLPDTANFEKPTGFGLLLVLGLTRQLGGTIRVEPVPGTTIVLEIKK